MRLNREKYSYIVSILWNSTESCLRCALFSVSNYSCIMYIIFILINLFLTNNAINLKNVRKSGQLFHHLIADCIISKTMSELSFNSFLIVFVYLKFYKSKFLAHMHHLNCWTETAVNIYWGTAREWLMCTAYHPPAK